MLTVYTSTVCRPDYVQLLADALRATCQEPLRLVVHVHPGGLRRDWRGVDEVIDGATAGYHAWRELLPRLGGDSLILHDDCLPVLPWSSDSFPLPHMARGAGSTLEFHRGGYAPPVPAVPVCRIRQAADCPEEWSPFAELAAECLVESLAGGTFLHLDKGTIFSPAAQVNERKPALVAAVASFLQIPAPEPLTADELARHPGRMPASRPGLGDMVAAGLSAVGITEERLTKAIGRPCGCKGRRAALNEWGRRVGLTR